MKLFNKYKFSDKSQALGGFDIDCDGNTVIAFFWLRSVSVF